MRQTLLGTHELRKELQTIYLFTALYLQVARSPAKVC